MHRCLCDAEFLSDLTRREHATSTHSVTSARQLVCVANERNFLQVERLSFPCPPSMLIENVGDLAIAVTINKTVDLGYDLGFDLADFGDGERSLKQQRARSTAR